MKRIYFGYTIITVLCIFAVVANGWAKSSDKKDIVDTAIAAGSFNTLAKALTAAGLVETLKGKGPFTVFAPTDAAFAKLPAGTLEDLLKPENKEKLKGILTYHVVSGEVKGAAVTKRTTIKTLNGQRLEITVIDVPIMHHAGKVMVDNAKLTESDIMCSNGVIHVIDAVLMPK